MAGPVRGASSGAARQGPGLPGAGGSEQDDIHWLIGSPGNRLEQPGRTPRDQSGGHFHDSLQGPSWPRSRWDPCSGGALGEQEAHIWDIPEETLKTEVGQTLHWR